MSYVFVIFERSFRLPVLYINGNKMNLKQFCTASVFMLLTFSTLTDAALGPIPIYLNPVNVNANQFNVISQTFGQVGFVQRLKDVHPFFAEQELTSKIKQIERQSVSPSEEWVLGINSQYKNESGSISTTYDDLDTHTLNISASKSFADNGATVSLKQAWTEKSRDIESSNKKFSLDYTIPLWKNKDGINISTDYDVASIDIQIDKLDKQERAEQFLLEKLKRFIDLTYAQEEKNINEQHLVLAAQEFELTKKRYDASIANRADVLAQEDAFLRTKQQLLQSEQNLILLQYEIAVLLDTEDTDLKTSFDLYDEQPILTGDLKEYISDNSRAGKISNLNVAILQRKQTSLHNKLKPDLDFSVGLSNESAGTTYLNVAQGFNPAFTIGVDLTYPLGNMKGISGVAKNQVSIDRLELQKQEQLLTIYSQAMVLKEKIALLAEMMESNRAQIAISKERTAQEKYLYNNGQGQTSLVISSQSNEQSAILGLAKTASNYQKTVLDYWATIDKLLP